MKFMKRKKTFKVLSFFMVCVETVFIKAFHIPTLFPSDCIRIGKIKRKDMAVAESSHPILYSIQKGESLETAFRDFVKNEENDIWSLVLRLPKSWLSHVKIYEEYSMRKLEELEDDESDYIRFQTKKTLEEWKSRHMEILKATGLVKIDSEDSEDSDAIEDDN